MNLGGGTEVESVGEAWLPVIEMHSASTKSDIAVSLGEAGSCWPGEEVTTSANVYTAVAKSAGQARPLIAKYTGTTAATAVAKSLGVVEVRPHGIAKYRATTESELARPSGEDGSSESGTKVTTSTAGTTVAKSADEARLLGFEKYSATSDPESDLAETSDEESSDEAKRPRHCGRRQGARDGWLVAVCLVDRQQPV